MSEQNSPKIKKTNDMKAYQKDYYYRKNKDKMLEIVKCDYCKQLLKKHNVLNHSRTEKHKKNFEKYKDVIIDTSNIVYKQKKDKAEDNTSNLKVLKNEAISVLDKLLENGIYQNEEYTKMKQLIKKSYNESTLETYLLILKKV